MTEYAVVATMAALWWIPTFVCLSDLQRREGLRRVLVWRWTVVLCIPVLGAVLYWFRGRPKLDAA